MSPKVKGGLKLGGPKTEKEKKKKTQIKNPNILHLSLSLKKKKQKKNNIQLFAAFFPGRRFFFFFGSNLYNYLR